LHEKDIHQQKEQIGKYANNIRQYSEIPFKILEQLFFTCYLLGIVSKIYPKIFCYES